MKNKQTLCSANNWRISATKHLIREQNKYTEKMCLHAIGKHIKKETIWVLQVFLCTFLFIGTKI